MAPTFPPTCERLPTCSTVGALKRNLATVTRIRREAGCENSACDQGIGDAGGVSADARPPRWHHRQRRARGASRPREVGKEVHVYAPAYAQGEVERLAAIADHIYSIRPNSWRASARSREGSRPQDRRAPQPRLLERHPRRPYSTTRARPARNSAPRARRSICSRGATSTSCTSMRSARAWPMARAGPHQPRRARVRPIYPQGQGGEFRRRPLHQQARL